MPRNRDVILAYRALRSLHLPRPLFGVLLLALLTLTGGSAWPADLFHASWRSSAETASGATGAWKPGLAKGALYQYASATRISEPLSGALGQWDDGADSAEARPAETLSALAVPSDLEPILPLILRAGLAQVMAEPVLEAVEAPVPALAATTEAQQPVAAPAIIPEPSLSIAQLPAASSAPDRVVCPAIDLDQPVITVGWHQETINDKVVSVWDVAQYAVGWHRNSRYPGQGGNVVLAGHNNIYGEVFRRLEDLRLGDLITVYAGGHGYDYAVESTVIVKEEGATPEEKAANARWIGTFADERLTLVACYPYSGNSHRILIIARPRFKVS